MRVIIIRHGAEKRLQKLESVIDGERSAGNCWGLYRPHQLRLELDEIRNDFIRFERFIKRLPDQEDIAVFSSSSDDVQRTKNTVVDVLKDSIVTRNANGKPDAVSLNELYSKPRSDYAEDILDDVDVLPSSISNAGTWVLIGHHPRVSQFLSRVTGTRSRPLGRLHVVCVSANNSNELRRGMGKIDWRYPKLDVEGDKLGDKLQSKMVVGALLAGFDFTALLELLKDIKKTPVLKGTSLGLTTRVFDYIKFWCWSQDQWTAAFNSLSILCLSIALILFIASVYIFDTLAMPEGFLAHEPEAPRITKQNGRFQGSVIWLGFVYASMINTWKWVFTPAVVLSALAALLLIARTHSLLLLGLWCVLIGLAGLHVFLFKPRGITD